MASERGYYATLGVTFRTELEQITKVYKKLALKLHPDKNPSQEAADEFQRLTTSYHVIMDEQKRKNYLRLFELRCYMSQQPLVAGAGLRPHYAFMVEKSKFAMGSKSVSGLSPLGLAPPALSQCCIARAGASAHLRLPRVHSPLIQKGQGAQGVPALVAGEC